MRAIQNPIALCVLVLAATISWLGAAYGPRTPVDGLVEDAVAAVRTVIFGAADMSGAQAVILLLDERTLNAEALRGTPRALMSPVWAELADKAFGHGADGVAFDFIMAFDGGDLRIGEDRPLKAYDTPFLRMLAREGRAGRLLIGRSRDITPARRFANVASEAGVAFVDVDPDQDGVIRRMRLGHTLVDGEIAPTLAGGLLGRRDVAEIPITSPAPLTRLPTVSVIDILACDNSEALGRLFRGKLVLVGSGLPGEDRLRAPDRFMTRPITGQPTGAPCEFARPPVQVDAAGIPGVYLHAAAVDAVRSGWAATRISPSTTGLLAAAAGLAAAVAGLLLGSSWVAAAVAVGFGAISFGAAAWALELGYLTASARPIIGAGFGFACAWAGRLAFLDRRTKVLRNSFARYVAPEVVDRLLSQDRLPELEGERRHITVMFADLSGFTALSEQIDGKSLTTIVNRYLGLIATEVSASGGYVDKFIGDAVMAIWNAPLDLESHEHAAVSATIAIRDVIQTEAEKDRAAGLPGFSIKIGLNTGDAVVGNVGSQERLNYTAVGDVVNVSARLEGLPGTFKTPILIGEASARPVMDSFNLLEIASIQVKGRLEPLAIFAPLSEADSASFYAYGQALESYRARNFTAAAAQWTVLGAAPWSGANLSQAMAGFAEALINDEPDENWYGAIIMTTK